MLHEISQSQKDKTLYDSLLQGTESRQIHSQEVEW